MVNRLPMPVPKKQLPPTIKVLSAECDYVNVRFRERGQAFTAHGQLAEFKVINEGMLASQVHIHLRVEGCDKQARSSKNCRIDVDFYLQISDFRRVAKLLSNVRFKRDKFGVVRASLSEQPRKAAKK